MLRDKTDKPAIPRLDIQGSVVNDLNGVSWVDYSKASPRHSIYLLVPAFTFPEPLSTSELKDRCRETLGTAGCFHLCSLLLLLPPP